MRKLTPVFYSVKSCRKMFSYPTVGVGLNVRTKKTPLDSRPQPFTLAEAGPIAPPPTPSFHSGALPIFFFARAWAERVRGNTSAGARPPDGLRLIYAADPGTTHGPRSHISVWRRRIVSRPPTPPSSQRRGTRHTLCWGTRSCICFRPGTSFFILD